MAGLQSDSRSMETARARASFYEFVNIHFLALPDEPFAGALRQEEFGSVLNELEQSREVNRNIARGASLMRNYLSATIACDYRELARRLGLDRTRLYRGVSPGYGPVPPYEALWTGKNKDPRLLPELAGLYREGGFTVKTDVQERLDYVGIQLSFLERLVLKEIEARQAGDEEPVQALLNLEKEFLYGHVAGWLSDFIAGALEHAQTDFYRGHLHMLKGFLEQEKEALAGY